jgi:predicted esterase
MILGAALLAFAQIANATPAASPPPLPAGALVHRSRLFALPEDAVGYIPATAGAHPPLLVLLHGAGRRRLLMVQHFESEADKRGIVLLAPTSGGATWDAVSIAEEPPSPDSPLASSRSHRFGTSRDANRVEAAISALSKIIPVDRTQTVLAGFSDGATFALAMGMSRDHPFSSVIAWSPGIAIRTVGPVHGRRVFVSHGRQDPILNFEVTCGEIVPLLQSEGAHVTFLPFDGGHEAPDGIKDAFLDAAFGPIPGATAHPLPTEVHVCHPASERRDMSLPGARLDP